MKKYVVVDIDGTLSKIGPRLKYITEKPKNWDAFYDTCDEDEPVQVIIDLVRLLAAEYTIIICSTRRESTRRKTIEWLWQNNVYPAYRVLLRKDKDVRHDTIVKPELLEDAGIEFDEIALVLEDRKIMVQKWRGLGICCLQVADGNF